MIKTILIFLLIITTISETFALKTKENKINKQLEYTNLAKLYFFRDDYLSAKKYAEKAIENNYNKNIDFLNAYKLLAESNFKLDKIPEGREVLEKGIILARKYKNPYYLGMLRSIMVIPYFESNQYNKATDYLLKNQDKDYFDSLSYHIFYSNHLMHSLKKQGNYKEALKYSAKTVQSRKEMNDKTMYFSSLNNHAKIFIKLNQLDSALKYLEMTFDYNQRFNLRLGLRDYYSIMTKLYEKQNDHANIIKMYKSFDSIQSIIKIEELNNKDRNIFYKSMKSYQENEKYKINFVNMLLSFSMLFFVSFLLYFFTV